MIYLELLFGFLRVGLFAFGGAYAAIPLISDIVLSYGWLSEDMLTYMIAVSESTPGPIMVNLATFVGQSQGGLLGAMIATLAVVLPSFIIILLVVTLFSKVLKHPISKAMLQGIKPAMVGIIIATGLNMLLKHTILSQFNIKAMIIAGALVVCKYIFKNKISSISLIMLSAVFGILIYAI
jgi:chromate transporter